MAFPPSFLEELRHRLSIAQVVGRRVKLVRRGREHTGLCPFHNEKSPSFTVNEDKGFFHCFGCGAHGDVLGFVMRSENLSFPDAVERLAAEAGLEVPRLDPADRERAERSTTLADALEQAALWYQAQLGTQSGRNARKYLDGRMLTEKTIERFRLGFAPGGFRMLKQAMLARGFKEEVLIAAGLLKKPDDGGESFDYFRDRITFPITDRRGRVIAFGGRAMDDNPAKYLNSPETELFHKGSSLYNLARARQAAGDAGTVLVVEGYMDVIALSQAGLDHAVAPLGTALTEAQMDILWKLADEPVLCFDGDAAGLRAGYRAVDRALPKLAPGKSFRFALLPPGQDPDDLVKTGGREAVNKVLSETQSLADMLWRKEAEGRELDTPERRAAFEADLFKAVNQIGDERVKGYYRDYLRERLDQVRRPARTVRAAAVAAGPGYERRWRRPGEPVLSPEQVRPPIDVNSAAQDGELILLCLYHPYIAEEHLETLADWPIRDRAMAALRDALSVAVTDRPGLDFPTLKGHLSALGFDETITRLEQSRGPVLARHFRPEAAPAEARDGWRRLERARSRQRLDEDLAQATAALEREMSEENLARLAAVKRAIEETGRGVE